MAFLSEYREGVKETLQEVPDATRFQKVGLALITVVGIYADRRLEAEASLCAVEGVAMNRDETWTDAELEQELKELLDES
jgi:hypothetical protein